MAVCVVSHFSLLVCMSYFLTSLTPSFTWYAFLWLYPPIVMPVKCSVSLDMPVPRSVSITLWSTLSTTGACHKTAGTTRTSCGLASRYSPKPHSFLPQCHVQGVTRSVTGFDLPSLFCSCVIGMGPHHTLIISFEELSDIPWSYFHHHIFIIIFLIFHHRIFYFTTWLLE